MHVLKVALGAVGATGVGVGAAALARDTRSSPDPAVNETALDPVAWGIVGGGVGLGAAAIGLGASAFGNERGVIMDALGFPLKARHMMGLGLFTAAAGAAMAIGTGIGYATAGDAG